MTAELIVQQLINGFSAGMSYALIALGLTLVFGVLHVINFAHGELYLLGGLVVAVLCNVYGVPYAAAVPLAVLGAAVAGYVIQKGAVEPLLDRPDGRYSALLSTYAVSLLLLEMVIWSKGPAPERIDGILGAFHYGDITVTYQRLIVIAGATALLIAVELFLRRTRAGFDLRAISQDLFAAKVIGVDVRSVQTRTFVLAAAFAGVAGALMVPIALFTPMMGQNVLIKAFVVVVIGGMGSVTGAVVVGIAIGLLEVLLRSLLIDGFAQAIIYSLMIVMLLIRPQGLFQPGR